MVRCVTERMLRGQRSVDFDEVEFDEETAPRPRVAPGKVTLTSRLRRPVQLRGAAVGSGEHIRKAAERGVAGAGQQMPHSKRIQEAFGSFRIDNITAHVGGAAAEVCGEIGGRAFAFGDSVAFADAPDLHTAAHEAAHVIQQRAGAFPNGGVGRVGDRFERHADRVADAVVAGGSAESLLKADAGSAGNGGQQSVKPVQMDATAEREWFEQNPAPRASESGSRLILWNYPIDGAPLQSGHRSAIESFLQNHGLAFLARGVEVEVVGHASESGTPEHNDELSSSRAAGAAAVVRELRPQARVHGYGLGMTRPLATSATGEAMARNRSVEISILARRARRVPDREQKWRQAQEYLEAQLGGAVVGGGVDQMWTPTVTAITWMIPVVPTMVGNSNPNAGQRVPRVIHTAQPASEHMPTPHRVTVRVLGQMLERRFGNETVLGEAMVRDEVNMFIHVCRQAKVRRALLMRRLDLAQSQGGGSMIARDLAAYRRAEQAYFLGDPTCVWRYVD